MPRIPINDMQRETFASGRLNVSADASSFGFNVGSVGEGLSDLGQRITKSRQDVARFENAATLAKGRQDWMLDVQDRMDAAERGEISYKGMTEKFKSDYAKWAGGISANVQDEEMRRDLDLNMFEMQTTFLGQLKSFESRKMAESVRQNYDSIQAAAFAPIASAKSEAEIDMAMQGLPSVISNLPVDVSNKISKNVKSFSRNRIAAIRVDDGTFNFDDLTTSAIEDGDDEFVKKLPQLREGAITTRTSRASKTINNLSKLSETGDMPDDELIGLEIDAEQLETIGQVEAAMEIKETIADLKIVNDTNKSLFNTPTGEIVSSIESLNNQIQSTSDSARRVELSAQAQLVQQNLQRRNDMYAKNGAEILRSKNQNVGDAYTRFQEAAPDDVTRPVLFEQYMNSVDNEAKRLQIPRVSYFTDAEIQSGVATLTPMLRDPNAINDAVNYLEQARSLYGSAYTDLIGGIVTKDPALAPLGAIPFMNDQHQKRFLVEAIVKQNTDPNFKPLAEEVKTYMGSISTSLAKNMRLNNMDADFSTRAAAFVALKNYKAKTGVETNAEETVFGGLSTYRDMVISGGRDGINVQMSLESLASKLDKSKIPDLKGPNGTIVTANELLGRDMYFMNSPDGKGYVMVYPTSKQPVRYKNGEPVVFTFEEIDRKTREEVVPKREKERKPFENRSNFGVFG